MSLTEVALRSESAADIRSPLAVIRSWASGLPDLQESLQREESEKANLRNTICDLGGQIRAHEDFSTRLSGMILEKTQKEQEGQVERRNLEGIIAQLERQVQSLQESRMNLKGTIQQQEREALVQADQRDRTEQGLRDELLSQYQRTAARDGEQVQRKARTDAKVYWLAILGACMIAYEKQGTAFDDGRSLVGVILVLASALWALAERSST